MYEFRPEDATRFSDHVRIRARRRGSNLVFDRCPYCGSNSNDKEKFAINMETGQFNCFRASCGAKGNMITLAKDFDFSLGKDADTYYRIGEMAWRRFKTLPDIKPEPKPAAIAYLESRGISEAIAKRYHITVQKDHENVLVIPFFDEDGRMQFIKYRKTDFDKTKDKAKEWCENNCKPILFGMDNCNLNNKTLIITEGQLDSLSCSEAGVENAVSVPTGARGFTWVPHCWDWLQNFNTIIVFGDYENGRITLLDEIRQRFSEKDIRHVPESLYKGCKDANDILRKHGKGAIIEAVNGSVEVEDEWLIDLASMPETDFVHAEKIRTGFPALDKYLGGVRMGQLIILTGKTGGGKSTFASQLATFALMQGKSVMVYSAELASDQFRYGFERQIAGDDFLKGVPDGFGNTDFMIRTDSLEKIRQWYKGRLFLYNNAVVDKSTGTIGTKPIEEVMKNAINRKGCEVLFIDNLMTAINDDSAQDFNRLQSEFVRKMVFIAKTYGVIVVLIAHPRKSQFNKLGSDDISGSANIGNLADIVLNFSRPAPDPDNPPNWDREIHVIKNRNNGRVTDEGIKLYYQYSSGRISEDHNFGWFLGWETDQNGFVDVEEDITFD